MISLVEQAVLPHSDPAWPLSLSFSCLPPSPVLIKAAHLIDIYMSYFSYD